MTTISAGDTVRFTPANLRRHCVVEGILVEEIKNQSGERGWHILSPLPQDPGRVVRVWESTGVLETVVATPAQSEPVTKLSVADAGAYLAQRNREGAFGYSWDEIERRQGGRLTRNA